MIIQATLQTPENDRTPIGLTATVAKKRGGAEPAVELGQPEQLTTGTGQTLSVRLPIHTAQRGRAMDDLRWAAQFFWHTTLTEVTVDA